MRYFTIQWLHQIYKSDILDLIALQGSIETYSVNPLLFKRSTNLIYDFFVMRYNSSNAESFIRI